ncbi:MAG: site-specific integrase [Gammaproteobacteria bacterium]|nr:MAG: site-specific integrase [Gammaproteobacteria bacterium]
MTAAAYFQYSKVLRRLREGPLGVHIDRYAARLLREGHCYQSGARCIRVVGDFSRWLARKRLDIRDVDERAVEQYQRFRARYRHPFLSDRPALYRLLVVLREIDVIAPQTPIVPSPLEQIEQDFERYLSQERGLSRRTALRHRRPLRKFLREHCAEGIASFSKLTGANITRFVEHHAHDQSPRSAQCMCWTLRTFTRYLLYRGHIAVDLSVAVPSVRTWRFAALPEHLSPDQIQQVLDSCDRRGSIGRRDYAVLLLLARLGLRANEIATLTLDDVDWHSGRLTIRGKGRRRACVPLLSEVGAALADYLEHGRPRSDSRRVFVLSVAPHIGFASSSGISMIAASALTRAGLDVRRKGTHIFRHSLATELLRAGASLTEIGQVLRHQDHDTTRIYAKVDIDALRTLGLPWPGGVR